MREAACTCIAELGNKISPDAVRPHVSQLITALLDSFHDESWPVRDGKMSRNLLIVAIVVLGIEFILNVISCTILTSLSLFFFFSPSLSLSSFSLSLSFSLSPFSLPLFLSPLAACLACGNFITCFPEDCHVYLSQLYPLFLANLEDSIPSVRQGGAIAIGNLVKTYGKGEGERERKKYMYIVTIVFVILKLFLFLLL